MGSTPTTVPPLTAHLTHPAPTAPQPGHHGINLGRDKVNWSHEVWERIDRAVTHEVRRTRVAARFLPHYRVAPSVTYVAADVVLSSLAGPPFTGSLPPLTPGATPPLLNIDDTATTRIIETWVEFSLTPQQVEQESKLAAGHHMTHPAAHPTARQATEHESAHGSNSGHDGHGKEHAGHHSHHHHHHGFSSAVTLATRAANTLCEAEDTVLFQGSNAINTSALFSSQLVNDRVTPPFDFGLLVIGPTAGQNLPAGQVISVPQVGPSPLGPFASYSQNTVAAINEAYSALQANGHYGPYACVLFFYPFADSYAPLANTLILPADRINPLMTEGYFGTGTMPGIPTPPNPNPGKPVLVNQNPTNPNTQSMGLVVSTGGNTMDIVYSCDPVTGFMQVDQNGFFRFRVLERFALRLKDESAVIRLEFQ